MVWLSPPWQGLQLLLQGFHILRYVAGVGKQVTGPISARGQGPRKPPLPPPPKAAPSPTPTAALPVVGDLNLLLGPPARVPLGGVGRGVELLAKQAEGLSSVLVHPGKSTSFCPLVLKQPLLVGRWPMFISFDRYADLLFWFGQVLHAIKLQLTAEWSFQHQIHVASQLFISMAVGCCSV